jgi:8-oxo-dGTP pyrophosphatase MutT (NUDIX family)
LLTDDGKVVAQAATGSSGQFVRLPGGGVDAGESLWEAGSRETLEETGVKIKNGKTREIFLSAKYVWEKEFADSPNRKKRYAEFQGEQTTILFGRVASTGKATSTEGDAWKGGKVMSLKKVISILDNQKTHPNMVELTVSLKCAARAMEMK